MSDPIRILFMGTPDFAVPTLRRLMDDPRFTVVAVATQPDRPKGRGKKLTPPPVKVAAESAGLPVLQPERAREPSFIDACRGYAPDYLVVVAYGQILVPELLAVPRYLPVNLHGSLLPRWRGAAPIHRAFLAGDVTTGVCTMVMAEGLDTGDVLLCESTPIGEDDTVGTLHDRLAEIGAELMTRTLVEFAEGGVQRRPQPEEGVTYAKKLDPAEFAVDWSRPAAEVSRHIRGLSPFPGAVATLGGKMVKLLFATVVDASGAPGEVVAVGREGIVVACGTGAVLVTEVKPEGKGTMTAHAFTLGHDVTPGMRFG